ncbi:MAG: phosphoribosylanthranilate isomerase [Candidatus Methanofastidiosia archaeon]
MWIKICGITCEEELEDAIRVNPDALGFVIETKRSKRSLSLKRARKLIDLVPSFISIVVVTLNAKKLRYISKFADYIQIYQDPQISLKSKLIRSYVFHDFDFESFEGIENNIDMILIDSGHGSGIVHDWSFTRRVRERVKKPLILAGGLNPKNVVSAIEQVRPFGVDVSSGVESNGRKDYSLMKEFVKRTRGVESVFSR